MYLNEFDAYPAQWLRNLWPGSRVDVRSIAEVQGFELAGVVEAHFFAGIGGWPLALRMAGWPDDREVWTGSCPCQPFSVAGKGAGTDDPRHLWPEFRRLIAERHPATVFGEQVASKAGRDWLAGVRVDLEALGYAVGAADLCAASVGAPHIRQRLYWLADALPAGRAERRAESGHGPSAGRRLADDGPLEGSGLRSPRNLWCNRTGNDRRLALSQGEQSHGSGDTRRGRGESSDGRTDRRLANPNGGQSGHGGVQPGGQYGQQSEGAGIGGLADTIGERGRGWAPRLEDASHAGQPGEAGGPGRPGFWSDSALIPCRDGKARRTQPGLFPLAHGVPGRVGKLRAYGNAIVPEVAAAFIAAFLDGEVEMAGLALV